jgi:purine-binding chemotaxis protein CheW
MDLAKIRKKSLQTLKETCDERPAVAPPVSSSPELINNTFEMVQAAPVFAAVDLFQNEQNPAVAVPAAVASQLAFPTFTNRATAVYSTPLEAILAGRSAAGCDDESILVDDATGEIAAESCLEFLCFRVFDEIYGINIMDIKEIIKPREVTEVPRAPVFVSGILSLRGTIIPIVDMRIRLGLAREEPTGKERIIVIKNKNSFSGLLVDEVIQVVQVQPDSVEAAPTVLEGIDRDFVSGLGRSDGRLIIILNLENVADINLY